MQVLDHFGFGLPILASPSFMNGKRKKI